MSDKQAVTLDVLALVSGAERASITPELDLVADLGIDSPKALRLLVELEERLDIEIPDEDVSKISTVGDIYAYVNQHG